MFLATSSSTVGWFLSCANSGEGKNAAEMKGIKKRRVISIFFVHCETPQRHEYSKQTAKQAFSKNIFGKKMRPGANLDSKIIWTITRNKLAWSFQIAVGREFCQL